MIKKYNKFLISISTHLNDSRAVSRKDTVEIKLSFRSFKEHLINFWNNCYVIRDFKKINRMTRLILLLKSSVKNVTFL